MVTPRATTVRGADEVVFSAQQQRQPDDEVVFSTHLIAPDNEVVFSTQQDYSGTHFGLDDGVESWSPQAASRSRSWSGSLPDSVEEASREQQVARLRRSAVDEVVFSTQQQRPGEVVFSTQPQKLGQLEGLVNGSSGAAASTLDCQESGAEQVCEGKSEKACQFGPNVDTSVPKMTEKRPAALFGLGKTRRYNTDGDGPP